MSRKVTKILTVIAVLLLAYVAVAGTFYFIKKGKEIPKEIYEAVSDRVVLDNWGEYDNCSYICRITTSWATTREAVDYLLNIL